jgi:hypothetical protein
MTTPKARAQEALDAMPNSNIDAQGKWCWANAAVIREALALSASLERALRELFAGGLLNKSNFDFSSQWETELYARIEALKLALHPAAAILAAVEKMEKIS